MRRLKLDDVVRYPEDCYRIRRVLSNHSVDASIAEAEAVWGQISDRVCASWLFLPQNDDDLWAQLQPFVEDVPFDEYWDEACREEDEDEDEDELGTLTAMDFNAGEED